MLAASGFGPQVAAAADQEPLQLPGRTVAAVTVDLDGDGARELVRAAGSGTDIAIEAWGQDADAGWTLLGSVGYDVDPEWDDARSGKLAVAALVTRVDGTDQVVIVGSDGVFAPSSRPCCVAIHDLELDSGRMRLVPMEVDVSVADSVIAFDADGDGTDELAMVGTIFGGDGGAFPTASFSALRREGGRWETVAQRTDPQYSYGVVTADADGRRGTELLLTVGDTGRVDRLWWGDGAMRTESATLPQEGDVPSGVIAAVGESLLVSGGSFVEVRRWPANGRMEVVERQEAAGWPWLLVLGQGPAALMLTNRAENGPFVESIEVRDASLRILGTVDVDADAGALTSVLRRVMKSGSGTSRNISPVSAVVPGSWSDGRPAYLAGGVLLQPRGPRGYETRPFPPLAANPIGTLGSRNGWLALCDGCWLEAGRAALWAGASNDAAGRLSLVPVARLDAAADDGIPVEVAYEGAVEIASQGGEVRLLSGAGGSRIVLDVPPGTIVLSGDGSALVDHGTVDAPVTLEVRASAREAQENQEFVRDLVLIAADGRVDARTFTGTFAPETPALEATASGARFSLLADVTGVASAWADVRVDGRPVAVDDEGRFQATVDAPIWPRTVVVVARDPFGAEATTSVEVVGFVDYRGLPWAALVGVLTVVGGLVLFVRTPRQRRQPPPAAVADGGLEDIE